MIHTVPMTPFHQYWMNGRSELASEHQTAKRCQMSLNCIINLTRTGIGCLTTTPPPPRMWSNASTSLTFARIGRTASRYGCFIAEDKAPGNATWTSETLRMWWRDKKFVHYSRVAQILHTAVRLTFLR
jgi:hypothetical protein